jgi:hypothetical protein
MSPRRTAPLVAFLAVLGLGLTACSDGDDDADERTPFTRVDAGDADGEGDDADDEGDGADDGDDADAAGGSLRDCALEAAVADITGEEVVESGLRFGTVGRSGDQGDINLNDEGCGYELASGDRVTLADVVDGEDATALESFEALAALDRATEVADLGDEALLLDEDKLYVRAGDRIVVVKHDGDAGPAPGLLEALAAEVLAVDAG